MTLIWTLNLRHLQAVVMAAELQSISAAAEAVNLSQPAVTKAIAGLEQKLGCPLFDRTPQGVIPTEGACLVAARVKRAVALLPNPQVTLNHMRALIELAETGSYKLAQARTGLAASTLHRSVKELAAILNVDLVQKTGVHVMLSAQGDKAYRCFKLAKHEIDSGIWEIRNLEGPTPGSIRVGAMPLSRAKVLPQAIGRFYRDHPTMSVCVMEGSYAELVDHLLKGELDLMVGALRKDEDSGPLVQEHLFDDTPVVIARKSHPLAALDAIGEADYLKFPWIVSSEGTPIRRLWNTLFPSGRRPETPVECGSIMMIREILLHNDFLALVSKDQMRAELQLDWLAVLAVPALQGARSIGVTTRQNWHPTSLHRDFLDALRRESI